MIEEELGKFTALKVFFVVEVCRSFLFEHNGFYEIVCGSTPVVNHHLKILIDEQNTQGNQSHVTASTIHITKCLLISQKFYQFLNGA